MMRPIRFVVKHRSWGSAALTLQLADSLRSFGADAEVIDLGRESLNAVTDSILVFVKYFDPTLLKEAKERGNHLVWKTVDVFAHVDVEYRAAFMSLLSKRLMHGTGLFDGVIFPNRKALRDFRLLFRGNAALTAVNSHADPRWQRTSADEFSLVYVGLKMNIAKRFLELDGMHYVEAKGEAFFEEACLYSCHFSVRESGTRSFLYKPNTKLVGAAASAANIVLSKDPAHLELLDPGYPYYTDGDPQSVNSTIGFARATFGGPEWREGADMLAEVRERTTLPRIASEYMEYFQSFS